MNNSSLEFITCDELRSEFDKCPNDINKRILIIDVRDPELYNISRLSLDSRRNIESIKTKMRVMNINPDQISPCVAKNIMNYLNEDDLRIFKRRKDATEVIIIDTNTDNMSELIDPRSKVVRLINALTKFDNKPEDKIVVPPMVLKGGFREWLMKYPHFTTNAKFDPDTRLSDIRKPTTPKLEDENSNIFNLKADLAALKDSKIPESIIQWNLNKPSSISPPVVQQPLIPSRPLTNISNSSIKPYPPKPPPIITKPVPPTPSRQPMEASPTRQIIMRNAPGTAVPVTPIMSIRPTLPRSHSSPNVNQADGDELDDGTSQMACLSIADNSNEIASSRNHESSTSYVISKPKFDRTLKPGYNNESINAIRARLNFGRSPEASGRAITGLQNLGNTCFMNSVIQCLAYAPSLASYFCENIYCDHVNFSSQYGTKGELAVEFAALVEKLNAQRHRYLEPKSFRESIIKHIGFAGNEQQDSHEFMMMLFDKLHHDLIRNASVKFKQNGIIHNGSDGESNKVSKSVISDLFEGKFMSTLTCTFCKGQSNTFEVFNCLSLPIPSDFRCHLRDCLSHFSNPERIDAAWECPRCKTKREADKKIVVCKLPRILVIHLKRFSQDGRLRQKLQTTVDFPLTDLAVDCYDTTISTKTTYNLYAVVNHYGHLDGGHYTAFCRLQNRKWYTFDDSNVYEMKDADVCGQAAYILFYCVNP